jgi:uncharacterized protein (TIGR02594 family)
MRQIQYNFLDKEKAPNVLVEAIKLDGTQEIVGNQNNPVIMQWAKELGLSDYKNDEIPWCGLFVAIVIKRAGFTPVDKPLWAKNWVNFGTKQTKAMLFDVLVFTRPGGAGHVGFYIGEDSTCYHVYAGNQSNRVNGTRILKSRCIDIRRCNWKVSQPQNIRTIQLTPSGTISTNEG